MNSAHPLQEVIPLQPIYKAKVWGGSRIRQIRSLPKTGKAQIGESWEVADLKEGQSIVASGIHQGLQLHDLVARFGTDFVGTSAEGTQFPLLVKMIDAHDDLSIQVHPAERSHLFDGDPKDETWIILEALPDAKVLHGFVPNVTPGSFSKAIENGCPEQCIREVPVAAGDVIRVPPGTMHAICRGVFLLEVQQPSDTTFRVWDYQRPGLDGQPRALHIDHALRVAQFSSQPSPKAEAIIMSSPQGIQHECVMDASSFRMERLTFSIASAVELWIPIFSALAISVIEGNIETRGAFENHTFPRYSTFVAPAGMDSLRIRTHVPAQLIISGTSDQPLVRFKND